MLSYVKKCYCVYHEMSILLVAGIKCFSCNSHYDRNCGDPFSNYTTELVNCEQVGNWQTMIRFRVDTLLTRARNEPSRIFHNHEEGPYFGLLLVESIF